MDAPLLATKLRVPPPPHRSLRRDRLTGVLERGVSEHKLTLITAPPGYGKTTLLCQWAHQTSLPVAWLSLDPEDTTVDRFFRYLLGAWAEVHPGIHESPLGLLLSAAHPERNAVLTAFLNAASDLPAPLVFVLDDYQAIADPAIHEALTFLLDHLPPALHIILASRAEPPLPLARYRARHELLELPAADLQLREDETARFLHATMGLALPEPAIAAMHAQAEGWIAGLQLAALAWRRFPGETSEPVVSGQHRFIADFLSGDVLQRQPEEIRTFLLQTCLLDRLCGPLCDAVTMRRDSQAMLELLEREHLFLMPLDERREWFRYHRLFADFLLAELRRQHADVPRELHRRAAQWHLHQNLADEAFRHAVAGDACDLGIEIFDRFLAEKLHGGDLRLVQGWLDALPASWLAAYPLFGLAQAAVLFFSGDLAAFARRVDEVERRLTAVAGDEARWQRARVTAYRCFEACVRNDLERAVVYADEAWRTLREDDAVRVDIHQALGDTYRGHGQWMQAREHYLQALHLSPAPAESVRAAHIFGALADLDLRQGRLRDAEAWWRKALAAVHQPANWGRLPAPVIGWVYLRLSEVLYERDERELGWDLLAQGLQRAELSGDVRAVLAGSILASRYHLTAGDLEAAAASLERARPSADQSAFPDWTSRFERAQLELWLAQNNGRTATDWGDARQRDRALKDRTESEPVRLALARVLVAQRTPASHERALTLIGHLLSAAENAGRLGVQIEALALRAMALWYAGDRAGALVALERALRLAEPEGYVRLFLDLGRPMPRLLQEARERRVLPAYVARLLAACGDAPHGRPLPEPLSPREEAVLRLLAAGLTNPEIGGALSISPETVKKHAASIYGKLGVANRTQAVTRATELELLGP